MTHPTPIERDSSEPLALLVRESSVAEVFGDVRCRRIEFSSRGDRVPGRVITPRDAKGPFPVVVLEHGINGSKEAPYMEASAPWVRGGAAVASIDLPLHGERRSAKLTERLLEAALNPNEMDANGELLWVEFARQAVLDLQRLVDALSELPDLDTERLAYAGFSLGAMTGAVFCAHDPRPRGAALALAGGGFGPKSVDPCAAVSRIAPRPLLFVNAINDATIPRSASEALFGAASEPKRQEWHESEHSNLPGNALKSMWLFLKEQIELE